MEVKEISMVPQESLFWGVTISVDGSMPAKSKFDMLTAWKYPSIPREIMAFIGCAIFYFKWGTLL